jgi:hypothetical protein
LVVANMIGLVTGIIRFLLLRHWVYRPHSPRADATDRGAHDPTAELRQTAVPRHQRKGLPCRPTSIDRPLTCPLIQTWL